MACSPVNSMFQLLRCILTLSGLSIQPYKSLSLITFVRRTWIVILFLSMTACTLLSTRFWIREFTLTIEKLFALVYSQIFTLSTLSFLALILWQINDKLSCHGQLLMKATSQAGCIYYKRKLYTLTAIVLSFTVVVVVFLNLQGVFTTLGVINISSIIQPKHIFFDFPGASIVALIALLFMTLSLGMSFVVFFVVCLIDKLEFAFLNLQISNELKLDALKLNKYFDQHSKLVVAVEQTDELFKYYLLVMFGLLIPSVVLSIFAILTVLTLQESLMMVFSVVIIAMTILLLTITPAALNNEVCISRCFH